MNCEAQTMWHKCGITLNAMVLVALLAGCATEPTPLDEDFGKSVRQMMAAQRYEPPGAPALPEEPPVLDGLKADEAIRTYRGEDGKQEEAAQPIVIDLGQTER
jgi:hypothetical protein